MAQVVLLLLSIAWTLWLFVEFVDAAVPWPEGSYGLPKPKTGCPLSPETEWTTGWRFEDTEDTNPNNYKSASFHLDTEVGTDVNRTFCMKISNKETTEWPPGQYCIFKKEDCPKGFEEGYVRWDDEDNKNINKRGGTLPDGVYNQDTKIYYCCRGDGDKLKSVSLPVISPFYLKAFNTSECQRVRGAVATEEFIRFDNEDSGNKDEQSGSYPYGAGIKNHQLVYCYYESCDYTYSLDNTEEVQFTSPNFFGDGYPIEQNCTWRFVVPEKKTATIRFLDVDLEGEDSIDIVTGWSSGTAVGIIQKSKAANPAGYSSTPGSPFFIKFQSKYSVSRRSKSKGFRGIFTVKTDSPSSAPDWPSGTFGIPRAKVGCPHSDDIEWSIGWRYQDTSDESAYNQKSHIFNMDAVVEPSAVNRSFCIATKNKGKREWPKGQYCIYKKGACPLGLKDGYILFDDENSKNQNKMGGTLPDGEYNENTKLFYCCRIDGDKTKPMSLPLVTAFYLMAFNNSECQRVERALATKEYIQFHDESETNKDSSSGTHAYKKGKVNQTITYCYYEACHYTFSEKSQEFTSPNYHAGGYPNSQYCSWRFLVQKTTSQKQQVVIKFPEFRLRKGNDGDVIKIYKGWDNNAPLLAEFNGDNPPPSKGVASSSPVVFLVFISDARGQSQGFRGLFLNQSFNASAVPKQPITLPTVKTRPASTTVPVDTNSNEPSVHGKQTGSQISPAKVIIPVVIAVIIVAAMVSIYCIRRKMIQKRNRKALSQSQGQLVINGGGYVDMNSQEYDSSEELQDIFPQG